MGTNSVSCYYNHPMNFCTLKQLTLTKNVFYEALAGNDDKLIRCVNISLSFLELPVWLLV